MKQDVFERVCFVLREALEQPDLKITGTTTAFEIEGWDSFKQIEILVSLESEFTVKFTSAEMDSLKDVGDLVDTLSRKIKA